MNENDGALSLARSFGSLNLEPAVNFCFYPDQSDVPMTVEASLRTGISIGSFEPFMMHTVDIKAYSGAYFGELGLAGSWDINDRLALETGAEIGWGSSRFNEAYVEIAEPAFQLVQWKVSLCWAAAGSLYIRPHVEISAVTDKLLRENLDRPSLIQGGISIGAEF